VAKIYLIFVGGREMKTFSLPQSACSADCPLIRRGQGIALFFLICRKNRIFSAKKGLQFPKKGVIIPL
jgi:hypothetical protein